jgi:arylsulfatase A-like enzyme
MKAITSLESLPMAPPHPLASASLGLLLASAPVMAPTAETRPNVIIILADDLGYADLGCQGAKDLVTPHIDSLAANGVRCTSGYVSCPVCCPSRAGLLTGRYQQRFGFELNWPYADRDSDRIGVPDDIPLFPQRLHEAGYTTGVFGKWHLGSHRTRRPTNRGFDEAFWHVNGGVYFPDRKTGRHTGLMLGDDPAPAAPGSTTDLFADAAAAFITRNAGRPFFAYVPFISPHWPMQAKPESIARFTHIPDRQRRVLAAMVSELDDGVGRILDAVRQAGIEERTLIVFLSDNGGDPGATPRSSPGAKFDYGTNSSFNDPCRDRKGTVHEGGIRVPFLAQWNGRLPAGTVYDRPVISLDLAATALAAATGRIEPTWQLDGVDLLPHLAGEVKTDPHPALFWRYQWPEPDTARSGKAVRMGDWKLVSTGLGPWRLYDLAADIGETNDLAGAQSERVATMTAAWEAWNAQLAAPRWRPE